MARDETRDVLIVCDENGAPSNEYSGFWYHRTLTAKSLPIAPKDSLERFSPHSQLVDLERQLAERDTVIAQFKSLPSDESVMSCAKALLRESDEHLSRARCESREHHERVATHLMNAVSFLGRFERQLADRESENAELRKRLSDTETERDFWRKKHQDDNEGLMFQLGRNLEFAQAAAFRHGATEPHPTIKCIQIIDEHAESLRHQLSDREDAIRRMQDELNELRSESDSVRALLVRVVKYSTEDEVKSRRATRFERLLDEITRALESKP